MLPLHFWLKQSLKTKVTGISLASLVLISNASTAAITIEPITWNVIGLDSNKPATAQPAPQVFPPDRYPVGVEVCNSDGSELTGHKAVFVWDESPSTNYIHLWDSTVNWNDTDSNGDPITSNDGEGIDELPVPDVADGTCEDVYFWVQIEQVSAAYDFTRDFHIELWDDSATPNDSALDGTKIAETANAGSTLGLDEERELYVEYLVSQNRNAVLGFSVDGTSVTPGGSIAVKPGDTIQLVLDAKTATQGYEQLEVFLALPPDLFTINSVATTYSANSGTDPSAVARLYADGCGWENDPNSADSNYHNNLSCAGTGKYGGVIKQTYSIAVSENFASSVTGQALIYDFSGSSYHYNADYESATLTFTVDSNPIVSVGDLSITKSTDTAAQDEFFLTITNEGTNTFSGGSTIGFEIVDELPIGYKTKSGARNQLKIQEFSSAGILKAEQSGGVEVEQQVQFYNLSAAQDGGPDLGDAGYDSGERYVIWTPSPDQDFAPGDYITFSFQVAPVNNVVGENPYENCAVITTEDDDVSNNQSCASLPPPDWDLGISKLVTGISENQATFQLMITNYGPDPSAAVLVDDILPPGYSSPSGFTYSGDVTMSLSARSSEATGILLWNLPALAINQTAAVSYTITVGLPTGAEADEQDLIDRYLNVTRIVDAVSAPNNGTYEAATQRVELFDGVVENNIASASAAPTLLEINKTPDSGTITGPTYDYDIEITKVGVFQAGDLITVVEAPPPGMKITAIAGTGWDCTAGPAVPTAEDKECTRTVAGGDPDTYPVIDVAVELDPIPAGAKSYVNTSYVEATRGGNTLFNTFDTDSVIARTLEADLRLAKSTPSLTPNVGSTVTFTLTLTNDGPDAATNVEVTDSLPSGYEYVATSIAGGDGRNESDASSLKWTINSIASGNSVDVTYQAKILATGAYTNTAQVTASDQPDPDSSPNNDDGDQSEDDEATVTLSPSPEIDLELEKTPSAFLVVVGDTVTYTLEVTNNGPSDATGIAIEDIIPAELTYATGTASDAGTFSAGKLTWSNLSVAAGNTKTLTYDVGVNSIGSAITNTAQVTAANEPDIDSTPNNGGGTPAEDDEASATIEATATFVPNPSVSLTKTGRLNDDDGTAGVSAGDTITYAFTVTNTGNTTITDITLADTGATISGGPITSLAPGASDSTTFTATYTVTQADIDAGTYTNTATVTGDGTGTDDVTAQDDDTQPLARSASIALTKTGTLNDDDGTAGVSTGDTITYAFTVTNTGNTTITDIELADTGATISGGPITSLAPGASDSTTFTATYTVTQGDIDAGTYTNTATVTGDGTGTDDVTAQDDDTRALDDTVSLSGLVFQELTSEYNGLLTEGEQPTIGGGGLYVCLNTTPARYQAVGTGAVGAFAFTGLEANTTYSLILTTESSGASCPDFSTLNENWFSTGESVDGVTTDTAVVVSESLSDGKLTVDVGSSDVTTITMGLVQADVFDPPFGLKTGEILAGSPVIRWTMVWINDSPIPVVGAEITDPPPTGTTYVNGSISCEPRGTTTVSVCEFDTVSNTVHVVADFGPETGSPTDELTADNELLIVFDVTYDEANPEPEYVNQGTLTWDPGSGPTTSSTDDPTESGDNDPTVVVPPAAPPPPPPPAPPTPVPVSPWQLLIVLSLLTAWLGRIGLIRRRSW